MTDSRPELLEKLIEGAPIACVVVRIDGSISYANNAALELLGCTREELRQRRATEFLDPKDAEKRPLDERRLDRVDRPENERLLIRADQHRVWVKTRSERLDDGQVLFWLEDLSERHALNDKIREAQRVETVGLLAAGLAHDLNNLLAVIVGHADLLRMHHHDARTQSSLTALLQAAQHASSLISKLLAFGRKQHLEPVTLDLNAFIRERLDVMTSLTRDKITIDLALADELDLIEADRSQLEQVLWNLITNACQAMPDGGRLSVSTQNEVLDMSTLDKLARPRSDPHFVMLAVGDSGPGMPDDVARQAFDPYFTTRERGTGLGLSVVQGVVAQSGGLVRVKSKTGEGSIFEVLLPRAQPASI